MPERSWDQLLGPKRKKSTLLLSLGIYSFKKVVIIFVCMRGL